EMEGAPQLRRSRQSLDVPAEMLAELDGRAARIELVLLGHFRVPHRDREPLLDRRRQGERLPIEQGARLRENPRLSERSARDHYARTLCVLPHAQRIVWCPDVAIAKHGNLERGGDGGNLVPARLP